MKTICIECPFSIPLLEAIEVLVKELNLHYKDRSTATVLKSTRDMRDPFLDFHEALLNHSVLDAHTRELFTMSGRSHVCRKWLPTKTYTKELIIFVNLTAGYVASAMDKLPAVPVPTPQGIKTLPPYLTAYTMNRYYTNNIAPDLLLSYEPSIDATGIAIKDSKEQLAKRAEAYTTALQLMFAELGDKFKMVKLAPTSAVLPTNLELAKVMFDSIVANVSV
jgi:hypothetical protein